MKQKPFLKWAGGKYRCLDILLKTLPQAERLIEPFSGSGVIFLNTHYPRYVLAERNADLINLFSCIQQKGDVFIEFCATYFCVQNNNEETYYFLRNQFNECTDKIQRAALFLYLNRHGYNGLCRYNAKGGYNVPFGRYKKPYFPRHELHAFLIKSHLASLLQADFTQTFALARRGDVIYCDPPYSPLTQTSNFSGYTRHRFGQAEHLQLTQLALETSARGIPVIISNHDTPFTREQYRDSQLNFFEVQRSISCKGQHRTTASELIAVFHAR